MANIISLIEAKTTHQLDQMLLINLFPYWSFSSLNQVFLTLLRQRACFTISNKLHNFNIIYDNHMYSMFELLKLYSTVLVAYEGKKEN